MSSNVGGIDRILRIIVGLVLIALPFVSGMALFDSNLFKYGAVIVGIIMAGTAFIRFCPMYAIFGIKTCSR